MSDLLCPARLQVLVLTVVALTEARPRYSLPLLLRPHLHQPSPVHHFNFVANGHPYKITVNNKVGQWFSTGTSDKRFSWIKFQFQKKSVYDIFSYETSAVLLTSERQIINRRSSGLIFCEIFCAPNDET